MYYFKKRKKKSFKNEGTLEIGSILWWTRNFTEADDGNNLQRWSLL